MSNISSIAIGWYRTNFYMDFEWPNVWGVTFSEKNKQMYRNRYQQIEGVTKTSEESNNSMIDLN